MISNAIFDLMRCLNAHNKYISNLLGLNKNKMLSFQTSMQLIFIKPLLPMKFPRGSGLRIVC